ncbi:MAG: Asp-tRNA(Asn)/Glu-tRNA(Gln) amidotransferase subunit GatC [Lachnospiraceae bacterium]|nr:Asp-tRNA(Asn)/Glu-tRNA(Gln) amidotransferase subunit GatC [Lachnospiraceae bacterium]
MTITDETVNYAAALAKLSLTEEEREKAKEDLSRILGYIDTMNELETDGVLPMSHVLSLSNVFREDVVTNGEEREDLLANAPARKEGTFLVPKTVE